MNDSFKRMIFPFLSNCTIHLQLLILRLAILPHTYTKTSGSGMSCLYPLCPGRKHFAELQGSRHQKIRDEHELRAYCKLFNIPCYFHLKINLTPMTSRRDQKLSFFHQLLWISKDGEYVSDFMKILQQQKKQFSQTRIFSTSKWNCPTQDRLFLVLSSSQIMHQQLILEQTLLWVNALKS